MSQEVIDMGWEHYIKELDDKLDYVDVGIVSSKEEYVQGNFTMAQLATVQEFGTEITVTDKMRMYLRANGMPIKNDTKTITIPSRPFMRQTFDERESELAELADSLEKRILTNKSTKHDALKRLGQTHRQQIQSHMKESDNFEPNHPFTLKQKKPKTKPLINTGRMRQAIDFEVG